jgi:hypothetical protein
VPGVVESAINLLPLLLLGYRTMDELRTCYPDAYVEDSHRPLMSALFPRVRAFIHTIY